MLIRFRLIVSGLCLLSACASRKMPYQTWVQLEEWDSNGNNVLDSVEFLKGYRTFGLHKAWTDGKESTTCQAIVSHVFPKADADHDHFLDSMEFSGKHMKYLVGAEFSRTIAEKFGDKRRIDSAGFNSPAVREKICDRFDSDGNNLITADELAMGMFSVFDQDHNGKIGGMEFYLWEIYQPHLNGGWRLDRT